MSGIALSIVQTDGVMRVLAQIRFLFVVNLVRLALIVALMKALMTIFGLLGPVLVTLAGMLLAKGLHLVRMKRLMGLRSRELLPWRSLASILAVSTVSAVAVVATRALIPGPKGVVLLLESLAFALTCLPLLFVTGLIEPGERAAIAQWFRPRGAPRVALGETGS